jgi:hypothetical protein
MRSGSEALRCFADGQEHPLDRRDGLGVCAETLEIHPMRERLDRFDGLGDMPRQYG